MIEISVVIPVYNERESLPLLLEKLHATLDPMRRPYEIVLVDDGSVDGTWEFLRDARTRDPRLHLIRFRRNYGQTAAMSAGFQESKGAILVTMDADLQNDPADIPALVARIDAGADVVSGWRQNRQDPFLNRRLPSILANGLIGRITGVRLHDYGCTLKAYRREIVANIRLYGEMHRFIPALASWVGGRIDEVVVRHHPRRFGRSKYGISRTVRVILDLVTVKFQLRYSTRPIHVFGQWGLMFGGVGLGLLAFIVLAHLSFRIFHTALAADLIKRPFWVMTAFMMVFFGVQFILMGLLAEIQIRTYHESQQKPIYLIRETIEPDDAAG